MQAFFQNEPESTRRRIPFRMVSSTGTAQTGLSFVAGDLRLAKNGAAEANHAGTVGEVAGGLYYYQATQAECDTLGFLSLRVVKTGALDFIAVIDIREDTVRGAIVSDAGNTTSAFKTDLTSSEDDAYKDLLILYLSGANKDQVKKCSGYNGTTKVLSASTAFTDVPAAGDKFRILNR
jgi:hypothetical protein